MKRYLIKGLVVWVMSLFLLPCLLAKTEVPTLKKVSQPTKAATQSRFAVGSGNVTGATEQSQQSPLDAPFAIKHSYPGGGISTNVVALDMTTPHPEGGYNMNICSGFRYHKYWIATAAHCLQNFGTATNPRVVAGIEQLPNGVWRVALSVPTAEVAPNATIYFYHNGYSSDRSVNGGYADAEDIAIIGLDKKDKLIDKVTADMKKLDATFAQEKNIGSIETKTKGVSFNKDVEDQAFSMRAVARKKTAKIINDKKRFLQLPLDDYHFMTFSVESARLELAGRAAEGYYFYLGKYVPPTERQLPEKVNFTFNRITNDNNHTVIWNSSAAEGTSGSPIIIGGYVVGLLSSGIEGTGIASGQGRGTALLTDKFTDFLKSRMGADFKQGLCLRSVANEEAITERTQP